MSLCASFEGSFLTYVIERGWFGEMVGEYELALGVCLNVAYKHFVEYNKEYGKPVSHPRFTPARLHRKGRTQMPSLSSKGAASKRITYWLASLAERFGCLDNATPLDQECCTCMIAYAEMLKRLDMAPLLLSENDARAIHNLGIVHLRSYSALRNRSARTFGHQALNRSLWPLVPKHHYLLHLPPCLL